MSEIGKEMRANSFVTTKRGGVFYDKLGAEVGTQNPINGALATFIDRLS